MIFYIVKIIKIVDPLWKLYYHHLLKNYKQKYFFVTVYYYKQLMVRIKKKSQIQCKPLNQLIVYEFLFHFNLR